MANLDFYKSHLGISDIESLCQALCNTFIETNHTYDFFVNWEKVTQNRDAFKYEMALLKSLRNARNPIKDSRSLLSRYPEVVKVIPILLALRDGLIKVLDAIEPHYQYKTFDFSKEAYTPAEIADIVEFMAQTGLLEMLRHMESTADYLLGVEVGLDSNARKNRSGLFLERMVTETLQQLSARNSDLVFVEQKSFGYIEANYKVKIPQSLKDRKFDYVVINRGKATNIEVNFYSGTGSKPSEIVSSYINRNEVLSSAGWKFIWLTDGMGWIKMKRPLLVGVENIDYVINAHLLRTGLLESIII